jgi:photosystem II stability/assembly factor-like uncharacterized protein
MLDPGGGFMVTASLRFTVLVLAFVAARPASAQWTRVTDVPVTIVFSVWANGDTIAAGADSVAYVSTDAGATWTPSATVGHGVTSLEAVRMRRGRLYAGTRGQGVFVSNDLGRTWLDFSQGLVRLGALVILDLHVRGDSLYAATEGGGPWVRNLNAGTWSHIGHVLEDFQAGNMCSITSGGSRLFATGGFNGTVFFLDAGQPDWTLSLLFNDRFAPGLAGLTAIWTGRGWVVGSNIGPFFSADGQSPWTRSDLSLPTPLLAVSLALSGRDLFGSFENGSTTIATSHDDGATWQVLDSLPSVLTIEIAVVGNTLYAGRADGLWRRPLPPTAVAPLTWSGAKQLFMTQGHR